MKVVKFVQDSGVFKAGETHEIEDQAAVDAIAAGIAAPTIFGMEEIPPKAAPETRAAVTAPEKA
jgi:hypothetical protein